MERTRRKKKHTNLPSFALLLLLPHRYNSLRYERISVDKWIDGWFDSRDGWRDTVQLYIQLAICIILPFSFNYMHSTHMKTYAKCNIVPHSRWCVHVQCKNKRVKKEKCMCTYSLARQYHLHGEQEENRLALRHLNLTFLKEKPNLKRRITYSMVCQNKSNKHILFIYLKHISLCEFLLK